MNFSWAMDLDPKDANNQFKEAIDPAINFPADGDDNTNNNPQENSKLKGDEFYLELILLSNFS